MRILIADEQSKVRFAIHVLLKPITDIKVVGEAADAPELLSQLTATKPDVVILDWLLPDIENIASIIELKRMIPGLFIIAMSGRPELEQAALDAGADDFVSKIDPPERLLFSIVRCQAGLEKKESR